MNSYSKNFLIVSTHSASNFSSSMFEARSCKKERMFHEKKDASSFNSNLFSLEFLKENHLLSFIVGFLSPDATWNTFDHAIRSIFLPIEV